MNVLGKRCRVSYFRMPHAAFPRLQEVSNSAVKLLVWFYSEAKDENPYVRKLGSEIETQTSFQILQSPKLGSNWQLPLSSD